VKRFFREIQEEVDTLLYLRWKYVRVKSRYFFQKIREGNRVRLVGTISSWALILVITIIIILIGYRYPAAGFSDYISPSGEFQRGKTIWDWMQLLIIPLILARVAYYLTNTQREKSGNALQNYLDYMTKLLIEHEYLDDEEFERAARLMRARTLMVLEQLSGKQKGHLLRFLIETELLHREKTCLNMKRANLTRLELEPGAYSDFNLDGVNLDYANLGWCHFRNVQMKGVSMRNADLEDADFTSASLEYILLNRSNLYSAKFGKANMYKANLQDANLEGAILRETILSRSNLRGVNLRESFALKISLDSSDLSFANLKDADFGEADLTHVNFYGANFRNVNLTNANLTDSNITERQLRKAKSFEGAKLPSSIRIEKLR